MPRLSRGGQAAAAADANAQPPPQQPAAAPQPQPPLPGLPAPAGITYDSVLIQAEGVVQLTIPRFTMPDGQSTRAVKPQVTFVPQRYLEMLLFNRTDGGSSGAVGKILNKLGIGRSAWLLNAAAVRGNQLSQTQLDFIATVWKELMPDNSDAVLAGRTRNVTLLPIASAAAVCRHMGRSPVTIAFLRACAPTQVPRSWELQEQQEELEEDEADPVLEDDLAAAEDADADLGISFADEVNSGGLFSGFKTNAADEAKAREYGLKAAQIPANLSKEADTYLAFKVEPLEARRASTAVVETTAKADMNAFYRFVGFLKLKNLIPADVHHPSLALLIHPSAPDWISRYGTFMKDERELAYSTMANYLSSLFSLANYVWNDSADFEVDDAVRTANHTVLDALVNLRSQCDSLAKEAGLYAEKRGGWMSWEDAQKARVKCLNALNAYTGTDPTVKKQLLMDAIVLTIFTYQTVDRVGSANLRLKPQTSRYTLGHCHSHVRGPYWDSHSQAAPQRDAAQAFRLRHVDRGPHERAALAQVGQVPRRNAHRAAAARLGAHRPALPANGL